MNSNIKEIILRTLNEASSGLRQLEDPYYIIGASALILSGVPISKTGDIDIVTSKSNSELLREIWYDKFEANPTMKESDKFISEFSRFKFPDMDIEVMGDLLVKKNDRWIPLEITDYKQISVNGFNINIPTLEDQIRILELFGRKKDYDRIEIIKGYLG